MKKSVFALSLLSLPFSAFATDGYFQHGYGLKAQGLAGASTALTHDAFGGANNPATMVFAGNRVDAELTIFNPIRSAKREGAGSPEGKVKSDSNYFYIPSLGYNRLVNDKLSLGLTIYGNGGMNTDYNGKTTNCGGGNANILCGNGRLGVDLQQLIIAPTVSFKIGDNHALGVSPLLVYQRFEAKGLHAFAAMSASPNKVTNQGSDSSTGAGVRIGWFSQITDWFAIGAAYSPKTKMGKFSKYKGLFAEQGGFDIPENYNIGASLKVEDRVTIAVDFQRINYSDVKSVGNSSSIPLPLGSKNGPGFGWQDVKVIKLGVEYQAHEKLALRAGYNHNTNPVREQDVTFNILAPGVIKAHATLGLTYAATENSEINFAYTYAFNNSVSGTSPMFGGAKETVKMYQNILGIGYSHKF